MILETLPITDGSTVTLGDVQHDNNAIIQLRFFEGIVDGLTTDQRIDVAEAAFAAAIQRINELSSNDS